MDIEYVGIDHSRASIEYREKFAFTKQGAIQALQRLQQEFGLAGCVLLSTCNRTELWLSGRQSCRGAKLSLAEILCQMKGQDSQIYQSYFLSQSGTAAVNHLCKVACGLASQILGEDQIITQVKEAIGLAREAGTADPVLERLFRTAVTVAKKIKTQLHLTAVDRSAAAHAVALLSRRFPNLVGLPCLVIGNGEMGHLAAQALASQGCQVYVTLRQYKDGQARVPRGCQAVAYEARLALAARLPVVISATTSPHYTLKLGDVRLKSAAKAMGAEIGQEDSRGGQAQIQSASRVWIDLAVPRDIDPGLGQLPQVELYDIDSLGGMQQEALALQMETAENLIRESVSEFMDWYDFRELVPVVNQISRRAAEDIIWRLQKPVASLKLEGAEADRLKAAVAAAASKAVGKLLYGLKDSLDKELWQNCLAGLAQAASRETLKTTAAHRTRVR